MGIPQGLRRPRASYEVIGSICKNPNLLRNPETVLTEREFTEDLQRIVFTALNNIIFTNPNLNQVTAIDIDNYLSSYPDYYKKFNAQDGFDYVVNCIDTCNPRLFTAYYKELRVFSLLRLYHEGGIDVKRLYDYDNESLKVKSEEFKELMSMREEQIINFFNGIVYDIRDQWGVMLGEQDSFRAGDGIEETMEANEAGDRIGISLACEYENALFLGAEPGRVLYKSARSGYGKTRNFIEDACTFSCGTRYDLDSKQWVKYGFTQPTLFICTELKKDELQNLLLGYLSGVSTDVITKGEYSKSVRARIDKAKEVIKHAPLFIKCMEEFNTPELEMQIELHIMRYGVTNVIVDYLESNPKLVMELSEKMKGMPIREDMVLLHLSKVVKRLAEDYDIFIETGTQRNREESRDENSLAGGKATANKCDHGMILDVPNEQDLKKLEGLIQRFGRPNYLKSIYKNRKGKKMVYLWMEKNLGNMRGKVLFATDFRYNTIKVDTLTLEEIEDGEVKTDYTEAVSDDTYKTPEDDRYDF